MIVVLAVLSLMLLLVAGQGPPVSRGLSNRAVAGELATGLREARAQAIAENRPVSLAIDLRERRYHIDRHPPVALPSDLTITVFTIQGEVRTASEAGIRFQPDGSSTGGRIELGGNGDRLRIVIDWLTGGVSVTNAP
jgi:general secretion pathway protein H